MFQTVKLSKALVVAATLGLSLASVSAGDAAAAACRDAAGRFAKCPEVAPAMLNTHCRDKTTKRFAKCSAPNTEPLPVTRR